MTTRNFKDERRWARFDLSESRSRIYHHKKTGYEIAFGAYVYLLKRFDYEAAEVIKERLIELKDAGSESSQLRSCSEVQSARDEAEFIVDEETKAVLGKVA